MNVAASLFKKQLDHERGRQRESKKEKEKQKEKEIRREREKDRKKKEGQRERETNKQIDKNTSFSGLKSRSTFPLSQVRQKYPVFTLQSVGVYRWDTYQKCCAGSGGGGTRGGG